MKISGVGIDGSYLSLHGSHNCRMLMADMTDVIPSVQKLTPIGIIELGTTTTYDHKRVGVGVGHGYCIAKVLLP